jgi:transcriptional regulator with XRE-family HTH domain
LLVINSGETRYDLHQSDPLAIIAHMIIGERLRAIQEEKDLSQGDIEKRTGLLRHYISRVENGHTVPSIDTLEKIARALEVPLYVLFYDGEEPLQLQNFSNEKAPAKLSGEIPVRGR